MKRKPLSLRDYAKDICLLEPFFTDRTGVENEAQIVAALLTELQVQDSSAKDYVARRRLLHAQINTLPPQTLTPNGIRRLDRLLQLELQQKKVTAAEDLLSGLDSSRGSTAVTVWQGDITTLKVDAIVNAANSQLRGCWQPLHRCIDNAIHSAAGVQLRDDCDLIMRKQNFLEPTGTAKITRGYNLPAKFVLHTVGPIVRNQVTAQNQTDLSDAYMSCLDICKEVKEIRSVAFCCISTGVFGYPQQEAAEVAFRKVQDWVKHNPDALDLVVFNVFTDNDKIIYNSLEELKDES